MSHINCCCLSFYRLSCAVSASSIVSVIFVTSAVISHGTTSGLSSTALFHVPVLLLLLLLLSLSQPPSPLSHHAVNITKVMKQ